MPTKSVPFSLRSTALVCVTAERTTELDLDEEFQAFGELLHGVGFINVSPQSNLRYVGGLGLNIWISY